MSGVLASSEWAYCWKKFEPMLGEKAGTVPERERHEHEAGERGQLELNDRYKDLDRENEKGEHDEQPGDQQDQDRGDIREKGDRTGQAVDLLEERPGCLPPCFGKRARFQETIGADRPAARGDAGRGERLKDDPGERREVADDIGERTDIEDLLDEASHHVGLAA